LRPEFVDRFLGILEGETRGIILTGGEPTSSPHFLDIIRIAHLRRFQEIAVITNGSELGRPEIQDALLQYAAAVRVSLYDWYDSDVPAASFFGQLERVASLRKGVEQTGSSLEIGVTLLTSRSRLPRLLPAARQAASSGAHWLFFHPMCEQWAEGRPIQENQEGVLQALVSLHKDIPTGVEIHIPEQRYSSYPLHFSAFHAAHFLLQIGANGVNYAAPESKYQPSCALANLHEHLEDDFLWRPERLAAINVLTSEKYRFAGTRHRGAMFSDFVERCKQGEAEPLSIMNSTAESDFRYPHLC
jgi:hypothetical protein